MQTSPYSITHTFIHIPKNYYIMINCLIRSRTTFYPQNLQQPIQYDGSMKNTCLRPELVLQKFENGYILQNWPFTSNMAICRVTNFFSLLLEPIWKEQLWWCFKAGKNWILSVAKKTLFFKKKTNNEIKEELKKVYWRFVF